ncbi:DnaB-like helicase N-terminal domain-containing protein [Streptomyces scabiei]|uniref:DnaB-like helicase N-terminal domain-containing protein n=1 Tax=Streptomyces scabiei TaxID=1930 RepID=UPI0029B263D7|nr:DnaB-like helicase N-terminal domain-containing protein [Streptomyces scabiei]MDX3521977.1 DnaB-like helicase N-terminal domain-containing protein [Streptomyces scabiei]
MPHTPDSDEDDNLDRVPPPKPVHYAEQALLGALLLAPARLADTGALEAAHFDNRTHAALFTAIRAIPPPDPDDHAKETTWLNAVLKHARHHAPGLSSSYLHVLIQFCPRTKHAAAYTSMIRADSTRRMLRGRAERLAATATDPALPDPVAHTLAAADALSRVLDDLAGQFTPHPGSLPRTPPPAAITWACNDEDLDEERFLLSTATAYPADVQQMRWLSAEDFRLPLHGALWQCVTALVHRGDMVDPVTVLGEAQHRGLLTDTLTPGDLMALISTPAGSPEYWGERVLQRALLTRAHAVADRITAYADDSANTPHQLITGSRRALADLNSLRARWSRATAPVPSPARTPARSGSAPRAGPPPRPAITASRGHR